MSEIGWFQIDLLPAAAEDRLFAGRGSAETVFHWHRDTFDLPAGAVQLAQSPSCSQQAFRIGESAYGLQFHAEMVPELMELWLRQSYEQPSTKSASDVDAGTIRSTAPIGFPAMNPFTHGVLSRFAQLCRENARAPCNTISHMSLASLWRGRKEQPCFSGSRITMEKGVLAGVFHTTAGMGSKSAWGRDLG